MVPTLHLETLKNQLKGSQPPVSADNALIEARHDDSNSEARWWLQIQIGRSTVRALYDSVASTTVMGLRGLTLASACEREFQRAIGRFAMLANRIRWQIAGYVYPPMEVGDIWEEVHVVILSDLDDEYLIGVNFFRKFKAVLDL